MPKAKQSHLHKSYILRAVISFFVLAYLAWLHFQIIEGVRGGNLSVLLKGRLDLLGIYFVFLVPSILSVTPFYQRRTIYFAISILSQLISIVLVHHFFAV
jgi:hypothetical protein